MVTILRTLTALSGLGLLVVGLAGGCTPPRRRHAGRIIADGAGRTTQIGDSGAFFVGAGSMLLWGQCERHRRC